LLNAGIGVGDDFDEVLRNISKKGANAANELLVPENEADDLLVRMVSAVRDRFLFDPSHGLDGYLSKRIRHGSLTHYIRRPVETEELITNRSSSGGKYAVNTTWMDRLKSLSPDDKAQVEKTFNEFSRRFDDILLGLKDNFLHVRSTDFPKGMLSVDLSKSAYEILRAAITEDDNIDGLIDGTFTVLWALLQPSLDSIQSYLRNDTKREIAETFDRLRHSLSKLAGNDPEFGALSTAIGRASAAAQTQVDTVSGWFVQPRAQEGNYYTFEQAVAICLASGIRNFGAFAPIVQNHVSDQVSMQATDLSSLHEIIWVFVQNVHDHSGIQTSPRIEVSGQYNPELGTISLRCENEVRAGLPTKTQMAEFEDIRTSLNDGTYKEKLRAEGKSGFRKIADLVKQSNKGALDFGYTSTGNFFAEVSLAFVPFNQENPENIKAGELDVSPAC